MDITVHAAFLSRDAPGASPAFHREALGAEGVREAARRPYGVRDRAHSVRDRAHAARDRAFRDRAGDPISVDELRRAVR
ncbi:hypothetical protein [Streptosporangium sp. NPDC002524]|uniref:hypothetical protein n=1 Tax=Streptosporangium sp. NPDC002524 TaxID=3154537 RepID=UPI00333272AA